MSPNNVKRVKIAYTPTVGHTHVHRKVNVNKVREEKESAGKR